MRCRPRGDMQCVAGAFNRHTIYRSQIAALCYIIFVIAPGVKGQTISWAKSYGGTSSESGNGIALDSSGNTYVVGRFISSPLAFGSTTLARSDSTRIENDILVLKLSRGGNETWAVRCVGLEIYVRPGRLFSSCLIFGHVAYQVRGRLQRHRECNSGGCVRSPT